MTRKTNYQKPTKTEIPTPTGYTLADGYFLKALRHKYGEKNPHFLGVAHLVAEHGLHTHDAEQIYTQHIAPKVIDGTITELQPEEKAKIEEIIKAAVDARGRRGLAEVIDLSALFTKIKPEGEQ